MVQREGIMIQRKVCDSRVLYIYDSESVVYDSKRSFRSTKVVYDSKGVFDSKRIVCDSKSTLRFKESSL